MPSPAQPSKTERRRKSLRAKARRALRVETLEERRLLTATPGLGWLESAAILSDFDAGDTAGASIALSGDTMVVSANRDDDGATNAGAAYVYIRNDAGTPGDRTDDTWDQQAKLTANDAAAQDVFGTAVEIQGNTIVVGASQNGDSSGSGVGKAYIFERLGTSWSQVAKLAASDGATNDNFGARIALDGDVILIGSAKVDGIAGADSGAAYVYAKPIGGWQVNMTETLKLTAGDSAGGDRFGRNVDVQGDTILVGADQKDTGNGASYIFHRNDQGTASDASDDTWTQSAKLTASDAAIGDQFGNVVVLNGDRALITAHRDDHGTITNAGSAYVFERQDNGTAQDRGDDTWSEAAKLVASDGAASDEFGRGADIDGDTLVVGAWKGGIELDNSGSAYFYTRQTDGTWTEKGEVTASTAQEPGVFGGENIALQGDTLAIGDYQNGENNGAVFVFSQTNTAYLASDPFESGSFLGGSDQWAADSGWAASGDATIRSDTAPANGSFHARLRRSSGDLQRVVDVSGVTDVRLQFSAKLISFEKADRADVKVSGDGTTWTTIKSFFNGDDDGQYHTYDLAVPDLGGTLYIRFDAGMSGSADYWFIDDVQVTGTLPGPPMITISDASATEGSGAYTFANTISLGGDGIDGWPWGVARGSNGDIFVSFSEVIANVSGQSRIAKIDAVTGDVEHDFIPLGTSGLFKAKEIEVHEGWIYVANKGTNEILRFSESTGSPDPQGAFVSSGAGGLASPRGMVFDNAGDLIVSSKDTDQILKFSGTDGTYLGVLKTDVTGGGTGPKDIALNPAGSVLYVAGNDRIYGYSAIDGSPAGDIVPADPFSPAALEFGADGSLFATNPISHQILQLDASLGTTLATINADAAYGQPIGIAFDNSESLYVASNLAAGEMVRYASSSSAVFSVSLSVASDKLVTVDFATADLTATSGVDYKPVTGKLTFAPGEITKTIVVASIDDLNTELDETFAINLSNVSGATIFDNMGLGTIRDNDVGNTPPAVSAGADREFHDADATGAELVTLVGTASDSDGTITSLQWTEGANVLGAATTLTTNLSVGVHTLTLTAVDDQGASNSDTVIVTVAANNGPTADAGDDQSVFDTDNDGSETVSLLGSGADSDGNIATYLWSEGATVLGNAASITTILPVGTHTLTLTVTDNGGATMTDTVVVNVLAAPSSQVLFEDSFENGPSTNRNNWNGRWVEDSQNDYFRSTQRATAGSRSAEVDGRAEDATLSLLTPVNTSAYVAAELTFDWFIEKGFDNGEYLALDVSGDGGASWSLGVRQLDGNSPEENAWQSETVDLSTFGTNILIRFRTQVSSSREDANLDNVKIAGLSSSSGNSRSSFAYPILTYQAEPQITRAYENELESASKIVSNDSGQRVAFVSTDPLSTTLGQPMAQADPSTNATDAALAEMDVLNDLSEGLLSNQ